ncbi:lysylphosphatidylglycerol synthase transmembrane domain-containing protein [Parvibium lacunae]|uniref:UPF0104 family protein n=1 Tax=Parvibium lacunae TaxID=1888893 RepID=A0A368KZ87_9BURK|nr:lysylphosphatidylglycerol synthase transmembrane domain-containing protein [Parvibium lacunae]RCS56677.1 UPF0104 family protein [Parvibium lacunae]
MFNTPFLSGKAGRALAWSIALGALGYLALALSSGYREVLAAIQRAGWGVLLGMLGLSLVNYGLRAWRWHWYLRLLRQPDQPVVPWRVNTRIYLAGFALTTTPGKAGELARSVWLAPWGVPKTQSVAAFFAERLLDLLAILLLCGLGLRLYPAGQWLIGSCFVVALGVVLFCAQASLLARLHARCLARPGAGFAFLAKGLGMLQALHYCLRPVPFLSGLLLGVIAWGAEAWAFAWLLHALAVPLPDTRAAFVYAFAMLAGSVSFLPGGLGGNEATMIFLLQSFKEVTVPLATAVSATLLIRLGTLWFAVLLGVLALLWPLPTPPVPAAAPSR